MMNVKVISLSDSAIQLQIDGVDYSVSDIVHKELLGVTHVKFAGVAPPHPLIKTIIIQIHTDGATSPKNVVNNAIEASQKTIGELLEATRRAFPDSVVSKFSGKVRESVKRAEVASAS